MKKSIFTLLLAAVICMPLSKSWAAIPIGLAEDLMKIGVDEAYPMSGSYELTNDIDLSGVTNWVPLGMQNGRAINSAGNNIVGFSGTFDGKGYAIKNLTYSYPSTYTGTFATENLTGGIFGRIATATIKNLELRNLTITGHVAGALTGCLSPGSVIDQVSVIGCTIGGGIEAGGISGRTNNNSQTIQNCFIDQTTTIKGEAKVGGFVGNNGQAINITMTNCYVAATIECTGTGNAYGVIGEFGVPSNPGNMALNAVFVMAQKAAGTNLDPFTPDDTKIGGTSTYFACFEFFPEAAATKTSAELQTEATYTGWDFDTIWQFGEGSFPEFKRTTTGINVAKAEQLLSAFGSNNSIEVTVSEPLFLSVYDITGKALFAAQINGYASIPASKGIYILKVNGAAGGEVKKVLVK